MKNSFLMIGRVNYHVLQKDTTKKKKIINIKETHKDLLSTYIMFTCVNRKLGILSSEISFRIM